MGRQHFERQDRTRTRDQPSCEEYREKMVESCRSIPGLSLLDSLFGWGAHPRNEVERKLPPTIKGITPELFFQLLKQDNEHERALYCSRGAEEQDRT